MKGKQKVPKELQEALERDIKSWDDAVPKAAKEKLANALARSKRALEEAEANASKRSKDAIPQPLSQEEIAKRSKSRPNERWLPEEFHPTVKKILEAGYVISFPEEGSPKILEPRPHDPSSWGFDAAKLAAEAIRMGWEDQELIDFLINGCADYSQATPPVLVFIGAHPNALHMCDTFERKFHEELKQNWINGPWERPRTLPFHIFPGNLVPKKEEHKWRLTWNASAPRPSQKGGLVQNGDTTKPVAGNFNTRLPLDQKFEWASIAANEEAVAVMASAAGGRNVDLVGTIIDLKSWFRQHAISEAEVWKTHLQWGGKIYNDTRVQMGRSSAAHICQRTSFLITEIMRREVIKHKVGMGIIEGDHQLKRWAERRQSMYPKEKSQWGAWYLSVFQDDITIIAAGRDVAANLWRAMNTVIKRFQIPMSDKDEATQPFRVEFDSIGAHYNTTNIREVKRTPAAKNMEKATKAAVELAKSQGKCIPRKDAESYVGSLAFIADFYSQKATTVNHLYAMLAIHTETDRDAAIVTEESVTAAREIMRRAEKEVTAPILHDPRVYFFGHQVVSCDASGSLERGGYGVCVRGNLVAGKWSKKILVAIHEEVLSISLLELTACLITAEIFWSLHGWMPHRVALQNDGLVAVNAFNTGRARSIAMARLLYSAEEERMDRFYAVHIKGEDNLISDHLSRGRITEALQEAKKLFRSPKVIEAPPKVSSQSGSNKSV